jgi:Protein of unknown function (DUF3551)
MTRKHFLQATIMTFGILGAALAAGRPAPAAAEVSYPWCSQGEEIHCYYSTRDQCEEAVDYHGFCINNPEYSFSDSTPSRRARQ